MLSAVKVPSTGGETELADMRAGYAALDAATKDRIRRIVAPITRRSIRKPTTSATSRRRIRTASTTARRTYGRSSRCIRKPAVKNLFVGRHAFGIPGLERDESRKLLRGLVDFVVSDPARVYSHKWCAGDTLLWDNRALLHRAKPYDYGDARVLIGTRIAGDSRDGARVLPDRPCRPSGPRRLEGRAGPIAARTSTTGGMRERQPLRVDRATGYAA